MHSGHVGGTVLAPYGRRLLFGVPGSLDTDRAVFANLYSVALTCLLDVPVRIGDCVVVSGLGIVGTFCAQMAGETAGRLILVDPLPHRRERASWIGADAVVAPADATAAIEEHTAGRGADIYIEASGAPRALQAAIEGTGREGTIAVVSYYGNKPVPLTLAPEFHLRRLSIVSTQNAIHRLGTAAALGYRAPDGRRDGAARADRHLATDHHRFPFERAAEAYRLLDEHPDEAFGVVLDYEQEASRCRSPSRSTTPRPPLFSVCAVHHAGHDLRRGPRAAIEIGARARHLRVQAARRRGGPRSLRRMAASGLRASICMPSNISPLPAGVVFPGPTDLDERVELMCASVRRLAPFQPESIVCHHRLRRADAAGGPSHRRRGAAGGRQPSPARLGRGPRASSRSAWTSLPGGRWSARSPRRSSSWRRSGPTTRYRLRRLPPVGDRGHRRADAAARRRVRRSPDLRLAARDAGMDGSRAPRRRRHRPTGALRSAR